MWRLLSSAVSFAFLSLCDETAAFAVGGTAAGNFRFLATVVSSSSYRQKYQSLELNKFNTGWSQQVTKNEITLNRYKTYFLFGSQWTIDGNGTENPYLKESLAALYSHVRWVSFWPNSLDSVQDNIDYKILLNVLILLNSVIFFVG